VIREPVFILGAPRSATTLLFQTLARSSRLCSLGRESQPVLEGPYHPERMGWRSNALGAEDLTPENAASIRAGFLRRMQPGTVWRWRDARREDRPGSRALAARAGYAAARAGSALRRRFGTMRLLEKTPNNCLRIPFLRALFPDAKFLFLRRDGRPNVSSLMDGWNLEGQFESYEVPLPLRIAGYAGRKWCFLLPPGWRELVDRPLEVVCAEQWKACMEAVLAEMPRLRSDGAVCELSYEELTGSPRAALGRVLGFLGLPEEEAVVPAEDRLPVINARTPPDPDKWRKRNGPAVERILPRIAAVQRALGYGD
jgi:sulfotransferase family protein